MFNQARASEVDALRFGCKMDSIDMVGELVMVRWEAVSQLLRLVAVAHRHPPGPEVAHRSALRNVAKQAIITTSD
jgi:hypothetical protein